MPKAKYVVLVPKRIKSAAYVRENGMVGLVEPCPRGGVQLRLMIPPVAGHQDDPAWVNAVLKDLPAVIKADLKRVGFDLPFDDGERVALLNRAFAEKRRGGAEVFVVAIPHSAGERGNAGQGSLFGEPDEVQVAPRRRSPGASRRRSPGEVQRPGKAAGPAGSPGEAVPLVLGEKEMAVFRRIRSLVVHREKLFARYGLEGILGGKSLAFLFYGPSGTGKTQAARALGAQTGAGLLVVNHAELLSKYVGDTEKAIAGAFREAAKGGKILLVDEADSLVGDRATAERSWELSHVNTLLQALEAHPAVVVFATNFEGRLDPALNRRLLYRLRFGLPDARCREALWKALLPPEVPGKDIDFGRLAAVELTGGEIRNALVLGVLAAAQGDAPVATDHLLEAARETLKTRLHDPFGEERRERQKAAGIGFAGG